MAILSLTEGLSTEQVGKLLHVSAESVRLWLGAFLLQGINSIEIKKSPGRPPKLTKTQKKELAEIIDKGPSEAGFLATVGVAP